jgi:hypothetical protein
MRTSLSASRERPVRAIAGVAGYLALVTLVVAFFTTSGFVAGVAGTLTVGLLVGSYLLQRWARRRTVYSADRRPAPATPVDPAVTTTEGSVSGPRSSDLDESRMAKV